MRRRALRDETTASKFHNVRTLTSFSYDRENIKHNTLKRRVITEGKRQESSFVPRYSRANTMTPYNYSGFDKNSKIGHSKFFLPLKSTGPEELVQTNSKDTMSSLRQYRDDNSIIRELTSEMRLLDMSDLHWCSISTLPKVGLKCPNLRKISFRNLKQLNDAGIIALGEGCPRLLEVDLSGCTKISAISLIKSTPNWAQLQTLKIHGCKQIFDRGQGYGSQSSALSWKHLLNAAKTCLHSFIIHYEPVKTLYLLFMAVITKIPEYELDVLALFMAINDFFVNEMKNMKKNTKKNKKRNKDYNFLTFILNKINADEDHEIDLSTLFKAFEKTPLEMNDYGENYIIRGYMKDFSDMKNMKYFDELTHALVTILGNEKFNAFLEASFQRYENEFHKPETKEQQKNNDEEDDEVDQANPLYARERIEKNMTQLKSELNSYVSHVNKYEDLGSKFLMTLSSLSPSLQEVDMSYCETLSDDQLNSWSAPGLADADPEDLSEMWHEYNSWVRTGEWVITKEQLEQTTALGEAEEKYEIDKQEIKDLIAKHTHKSSMFHMEIHELKAKPAADGREGMTPQELKQLQNLNRKLKIAENRVMKTQKELEDLDVAINQVRLEAQETLASLAEGVRKKAPEPRAKLKFINLSGCRNVTDDSMAWFAAICPRIQVIKMMTCDQPKLTPGSIESLVRSCGDLCSIDLSGCSQLDKRVTEALITWSIDSIQHVSLSSCNNIKSNDICNLIDECKNMEHLEVGGHSLISEGIVTSIISKNYLYQLNINGCPKVSFSFVKKLRASYPNKNIKYFHHEKLSLNSKLKKGTSTQKKGGSSKSKKKKSKSSSKKKKK